jgi:hypothetical protein
MRTETHAHLLFPCTTYIVEHIHDRRTEWYGRRNGYGSCEEKTRLPLAVRSGYEMRVTRLVLQFHHPLHAAMPTRNRKSRGSRSQFHMSSQPPSGYIHLVLLSQENNPFYLEVPTAIVATVCLSPRKYLRYLGWCVLGVIGVLNDERGNEIALDGELVDQGVYHYIVQGQNGLSILTV